MSPDLYFDNVVKRNSIKPINNKNQFLYRYVLLTSAFHFGLIWNLMCYCNKLLLWLYDQTTEYYYTCLIIIACKTREKIYTPHFRIQFQFDKCAFIYTGRLEFASICSIRQFLMMHVNVFFLYDYDMFICLIRFIRWKNPLKNILSPILSFHIAFTKRKNSISIKNCKWMKKEERSVHICICSNRNAHMFLYRIKFVAHCICVQAHISFPMQLMHGFLFAIPINSFYLQNRVETHSHDYLFKTFGYFAHGFLYSLVCVSVTADNIIFNTNV